MGEGKGVQTLSTCRVSHRSSDTMYYRTHLYSLCSFMLLYMCRQVQTIGVEFGCFSLLYALAVSDRSEKSDIYSYWIN